MNHVCCMTSSDKEKFSLVFNKQLNTPDKNFCSMKRITADCKHLIHCSKTHGHLKMKRLKSHRKRNQMRGYGKKASKSKSHHHHCHGQTSKDTAHFHNCCHSHCPSRRDAPFPYVVPAAQEPSIITDSRLIGHQGLFNHEVKSIDIERLLSEQRKLEKSGQEVQEKNNAASHPSSTSHVPSPFCTNDCLGGDTDVAMPFEKKADSATKTHDNFCEKEKKNSQGSDLTPEQRPQQQLDLSSGSYKSTFSSKHSSLDVVVIKSRKTKPVMFEKGKESQQTSSVDRENFKTLNKKLKGHLISTLEHTPKNQESPVHHTQAHSLSPSPLKRSSSNTADSFDIHHRRQDPDCVSQSVSAVAARLCDCLQFPYLKRRSLVAESRGVLLKALGERHGPQLQENLLQVQRCLSFGTDPAKEVQDQEPTIVDQDELLPTDPFTPAITDSQPGFDSQKSTSFKITRSRHFKCMSNPQLHHNLNQTRPVETSVSLLDDILRPTRSPQFCMYFEPSGVTASEHLFAPISCWGEKTSASQHWRDRFNRQKSKDAVMFGSFENSYMNQTRAVPERSSGSHYTDSNLQPFFPYQAQLPVRHLAGPMRCPQEQGPFETDKYSFASSSAKSHHPQQHNHFKPFNQFGSPLNCPPLRSHHTDMMNYPPSHMLERDPAPSLSSFPSLEHWSFPPMRLY